MGLSLQQIALVALLGAIVCSSNIFQFGAAQNAEGDDADGMQRQNCTANNGTCKLFCRGNEEQKGRCGLLVCCVTRNNSTTTTTESPTEPSPTMMPTTTPPSSRG